MNEPTPAFSGIFGSLRRLADDGLGALKDRIELLTIELEEEKLRLIRLFILISAAVVSGLLALGLFSFTLVYLCSERARPFALIGLTAIYAAAAVFLIFRVRQNLARQPRIFAATAEELAEDRSCLDSDSPSF